MIEMSDDDTDERYTPDEVWVPLNRLFNFELDPCAASGNRLNTPHFYTKEGNGLLQSWKAMKCFVNMPYSDIYSWAEKAVKEASLGAFVAIIVPNDSTTKYYRLLEKNKWGDWKPPFRAKFLTPDGRKVDVSRSHIVFFLGGLP